MEATQWLLECTQCLPGAEEISAKIMGGDDDDDDEVEDVEVVEVEAVAAVSRDDEEEEESEDNEVKAEKVPAAASAAAKTSACDGDGGKVSSGKVLELPKSMVDESKKEKGSPSPDSSPAPAAPRTSVEVSATTPRSKFDLTLHESTGIVLRNKKEEVVTVPSSSVETVIVFPKAEDCRKATSNSRKKGPPKRPGNLVLLTLKKEAADNVQFRGKPLKQICFQLPQSILPKPSSDDDEDSDGGGGMMVVEPIKERDIELEWVDLLGKTFGLSSEKVVLVSNPAYLTDDGREERAYVGRYNFKSDETQGTSTTTAGMPYVKCYEGVNDGVLYPLEEGLLFFKPPKFVPRSSLHSIQCGRGGGDSRYVDLVGELEDDEGAVEFSNIARDELRVLEHYIHQVLIKAMERDANGGGEGGDDDGMKIEAGAAASPPTKFGDDVRKMGPSADESPIGASSEDDSVEIVGVSGGRSRRAASREAREATKAQLQAKALAVGNDDEDSDDDDEEDFVMHDESEDDDDDSEEDVSDASDDDEEADATESEGDDEEEEPMKKKAKML